MASRKNKKVELERHHTYPPADPGNEEQHALIEKGSNDKGESAKVIEGKPDDGKKQAEPKAKKKPGVPKTPEEDAAKKAREIAVTETVSSLFGHIWKNVVL